MVQTYMDVMTVNSGTAALTYGTAVNLVLNDRCKFIVGVVVSGGDITYTTAEGAATLLRIESNSINKPRQIFLTGPYYSSGPATNSSGQGMVQDIIALGWEAGPNATISMDAAPTAAITTARKLRISVIYADGYPPADWMSKFPDVMGANGAVSTAAQQLTVVKTAMPALTIPKWAKTVVGFKAVILKEGAITAAEEVNASIDFQFSQAGVQPQQLCTNFQGATLGTPVGTGQYCDWIPSVPAWIPLSGTGDITVTPYVTLTTAVTTGCNVSCSVLFK